MVKIGPESITFIWNLIINLLNILKVEFYKKLLLYYENSENFDTIW